MVSNFLNNQLLEQYLNRNFAQPVDTGMPVYNTFDLTKGGITGIPTNMSTQNFEDEDEDELSYLGIGDMTYGTPRTIADQNRILGQTFTQQPKSFKDSANLQEYFQNRNPIAGIMNLFRNVPTPFKLGLGALKGISSALQNTTFGRSQNLREYFDTKARIKNAKRMAAKYKEFGERDGGDRGKGLESAGVSGGVYGGGAGGLHSGE
jgi:hypothetical protein